MSEYWVSTPKYWCKFCKAFVRDTPFERRQHDATPKHQGNIQRSLRTMHRDTEREARETQRAKNEVARVSGIVSGTKPSPGPGALPKTSISHEPPKRATAEDRKKQLKQLVELGVAIPDEFRPEMALAGDWKTVSQPRIGDKEDEKSGINIGVRKRKLEGAEEEEEANERVVRKGWGSALKGYPGQTQNTEDIGALFKSRNTDTEEHTSADEHLVVKKEETQDDETTTDIKAVVAGDSSDVKREVEDTAFTPVVFKKRKAKPVKGG